MITRRRAIYILTMFKVIVSNSDWLDAADGSLPEDEVTAIANEVIEALDVAIKDVASFDVMLDYSKRK